MILQLRYGCGLLLICVLFMGISNKVLAQNSGFYSSLNNYPKKAIAFGIGVSSYYGDLQTSDVIPRPSFFLEYSFGVGPNLSSKTTFSYYRIGATDKETNSESLIRRNLSFEADNFEVSSLVEIRLFNARNERRFLLNPYCFMGIGLTTNNPFTKYKGKKVLLRKLLTEGVNYNNLVPVFPIGGGVRIKAMRLATLIFEAGYRFTNTDYLDDVSTVYPNPDLLSDLGRLLSDRSPEIGFPSAKPGGQRGGQKHNDGYIIMSAKLEMHLDKVFRQLRRKKSKFR